MIAIISRPLSSGHSLCDAFYIPLVNTSSRDVWGTLIVCRAIACVPAGVAQVPEAFQYPSPAVPIDWLVTLGASKLCGRLLDVRSVLHPEQISPRAVVSIAPQQIQLNRTRRIQEPTRYFRVFKNTGIEFFQPCHPGHHWRSPPSSPQPYRQCSPRASTSFPLVHNSRCVALRHGIFRSSLHLLL